MPSRLSLPHHPSENNLSDSPVALVLPRRLQEEQGQIVFGAGTLRGAEAGESEIGTHRSEVRLPGRVHPADDAGVLARALNERCLARFTQFAVIVAAEDLRVAALGPEAEALDL